MNGFLPGPWHTGKPPYNLVVLDANGNFVARAFEWNERGSQVQIERNAAANACLIAAAPELYDALSEIARLLAMHRPAWCTQKCLDRINAVLGKAVDPNAD